MPSILTATKYAPIDYKSLYILTFWPFWIDFALMHRPKYLNFMWTNKRLFSFGRMAVENRFQRSCGRPLRDRCRGRLDEIRRDLNVESKRCPQLHLEPNKVHAP